MKKALVSAIITTHNRKALLLRAINSVFSQTYKTIELIVVDDHSDDGTSEICKGSRINYIYISKEESKGGNYARNIGIKASQGEYCAFLDDDDYWLPTKIEKQVSLIEKMGCDLVHCGRRLEIIRNEGVYYRDMPPEPSHYGDMRKKILFTICTTTSCILVKRHALIDIGYFDENLKSWQEYELTIRLSQRKPFYCVKEPLVIYRLDEKDENRLTNKYSTWKESVRYVYKKHKGLYRQLNLYEKFKVRMLYYNDARRRCKASRLYIRYFFLFLICLPERLINYVKQYRNI